MHEMRCPGLLSHCLAHKWFSSMFLSAQYVVQMWWQSHSQAETSNLLGQLAVFLEMCHKSFVLLGPTGKDRGVARVNVTRDSPLWRPPHLGTNIGTHTWPLPFFNVCEDCLHEMSPEGFSPTVTGALRLPPMLCIYLKMYDDSEMWRHPF